MKWIVLFFLMFGLISVACALSDSETVDFEDPPVEEADIGVDEGVAPEPADTNPPTRETEAGNIPAEFSAGDCPFDLPSNSDIECGYLTVPENRTLAETLNIELAVAIVYASDGAAAEVNAPVVYLAGGPGGSALDDLAADPESWDYPFLQTRDLILIDQRGTGHSLPSLDCPEFQTVNEGENPDRLCFDRLVAEGIDLSAYNTRENAADVAALREALGITEWDLLGISYGTHGDSVKVER